MRLARIVGLAIGLVTLTTSGAHAATIDLKSLAKLGKSTIKIGGKELSFTADETGQINVARQKIKDDKNKDLAEVSLDVILDADPFISYGIAVTNFSGSTQSFSFTFSSPYVLGLYNVLDSSHSSSVTDSGTRSQKNDRVVVKPTDGSGFIHVPHLDGVAVPAANIATGCDVNPPGPGGGSDACLASSFVSVPVSTLVSGTFDIVVAFSLSPYDIYTNNGRIEIRSAPVPDETSTAALLFVTVVLLVATRGHLVRAAKTR